VQAGLIGVFGERILESERSVRNRFLIQQRGGEAEFYLRVMIVAHPLRKELLAQEG